MKNQLIYTSLGVVLVGLSNAQIRTGFNSNSLAANDDGSTGLVPIGFDLNFFGNIRNETYVNNNGNISFDQALPTFTPSEVELPTAEIIAPFFADVDTTGAGSSLVTYGNGAADGRTAFGVNWVNVGYFSSRDDKLNSFQLVIVDRSDISEGGFDIEFNYGQIQWETGEASGGVNGLGGDSARAGFSNGNGTDFEELPGSRVNGALLDGGSEQLIELTNVGIPGRYVILVRDGQIVEEEPILILTDPSVNTLRDTLLTFTSQMSSDVNRRLLRLRTLDQFENNDLLGSASWGVISETNPWMDNLSLYADLNTFEYSIDSRVVPNAGGLVPSTLPATDVSIERAVIGLEYSIKKNLSTGMAAVYSLGDASHSDGSLDTDYTGHGVFGYTVYQSERYGSANIGWFMDGLIGVQSTKIESEHFWSLPGLRASGDADYLGLTYEINVGTTYELYGLQHSIYANLTGNEGTADSYQIEGPGALSTIPKIDISSQKIGIGYQVSKRLNYHGAEVTPFLSAAYEEELKDQDTEIGGIPVVGLPESAQVYSAGFQIQPKPGMLLTIDGEHRIFTDGDSTRLGLSFGIKF